MAGGARLPSPLPAGLAALQYYRTRHAPRAPRHYRTPRALPGATQQERTAQATRHASLVEGVGLEPRVDDAASDGQAVAAGRRRGPDDASISNRISRRATKGEWQATKVFQRRESQS